MKHLYKSIFSIALAGLLSLASCSQEDMLNGGADTVKGHPVQLTLTVNRGETQTRTVLSENDKNGGLTSKWVMNDDKKDKLFVFNSEGVMVGELEIKELIEPSVGVFSGTIEANYGSDNYNIWYYNPDNSKIALGKSSREHPNLLIDLSEQSFSSIEDLSAMEVLYQSIKLNVKEETAVVEESTTMEAKLAMARFSLAGIENASGILKIFDEDFGESRAIYKKCGFGLAPKFDGFRFNLANDPSIEVTVTEGQDVYLAFYPGSYRLGFEFTADNGKKYKFAFNNPTTLVAGKYYCAFNKAEGLGEDDPGTIGGIPVNFEEVIDYDIIFKADPEGTTVYDYEEDLTDPSSVELPGNPDPENHKEFLGWKKEGSTDEPTEGPWNLNEEGKGPQVTLVPVYGNYIWTIEWRSGYGDNALVEHQGTESFTSATIPANNKKVYTPYGLKKSNPTRDGCIFVGWARPEGDNRGDLSINAESSLWSFNANRWTIVYTALWNREYKIVYHFNSKDPEHSDSNSDKYCTSAATAKYNAVKEDKPVKPADLYEYSVVCDIKADFFADQGYVAPTNEEGGAFLGWKKSTLCADDYTAADAERVITSEDNVWTFSDGKWCLHLEPVYGPAPKTVATPGYNRGTFN